MNPTSSHDTQTKNPPVSPLREGGKELLADN